MEKKTKLTKDQRKERWKKSLKESGLLFGFAVIVLIVLYIINM